MKLKPETVPTWDGNENTLARWTKKVRQLAKWCLEDLPIPPRLGIILFP